MKPTQLALARFPGTPTLHPSGEHAVVSVRRADLDTDEYPSQLWLVPTSDGRVPRQLTYGWMDASPRYSPDGEWIAFLRAERDRAGKVGKTQLWVMPSTGGEPRCLTDHPLGADAPVWSPDSTRLAYLAREPEAGRYGTVEGRGPDKEPPRRVTTMFYRIDGLGFLGDRPRHIWVVDVAAGTDPTRITLGDLDHECVDWSPDGDLLTFVVAAHPERHDDLRNDVWVCRPDGSGRRALTTGGLSADGARFARHGAAVAFTAYEIGEDGRGGLATNTSLWSVPVAGGVARRMLDQETYNVAAPIAICDDGVLFPNESRGSVELLLVPYDGGEPEVLITGECQVRGVDAISTPAGPLVVATVADAAGWGEVVLREWDGSERVLTDFNADYAAAAQILPMEEITATAPDGYPVHGWIVRPSGDGPHPLLLMIHGGPFAQYGWALFDEAQVYAGAGYAVLMANPRGSSGYGQPHGRAIVGNVGEVSAVDLMAILDHALELGGFDVDRLGVLGGSHGGFMTTWLAAHHGDRFRAAISERAVNAIDSFTGSSDIGWFFADGLYGPDAVGQRRQSPLTYANDITIPMLIIHSEQDWRCPIEQAQRLYIALRRNGTPAEMLIFPAEGHEMSRAGLPSHRIARFEAIVEWFDRYVK